MTTITLSNIPDLTAAVGVPRIAAIEYPFGRSLGQPGAPEEQMTILRATLETLTNIHTPGGIKHLPFEWPEPPKKTRTHPPKQPPIVKYLRRHPWVLPKLLNRDIPQQDR